MSAALSELGNDRIRDGGNLPPAFEAHKVNIEDLRESALPFLDGQEVTTPEEAEAVDTLIKMARSARDEADKARAEEKKPHDEAAKAVQAKWKPLVDSADIILKVCLEKVGAWRVAEKRRKDAEAARIRAEAEAEAEAARQAMQSSNGDLAAREQAEQIVESAKQAQRVARSAEKAASTGNGLRTAYRAEIADFAVAARHFWQPYHDRFEALVLEIAQEQVRAGKRDIPGITVITEQKAV